MATSIDFLTLHEALRLLGVADRTLRDYLHRGLPRNDDKSFSGPAIVAWLVDFKVQAATIGDADPLLAGGSSPGLERYRIGKAEEIERKNAIARGALIDSAGLAVQLAEIGRVFREESIAIERIHGPVVGDLIRSAVDRAEASWRAAVATVEAAKPVELEPEPKEKPPEPEA